MNTLQESIRQTAADTTATESHISDALVSLGIFQDSTGLWVVILVKALTILLIFVVAALVVSLVARSARRWTRRVQHLPLNDPVRQRTFTVSNLIASLTKYLIWPLATIIALSELNVDVAALIATAGVAGLALGIGAQTVVKDFIGGVLLLFDETIRVGDHVRVGTDAGTVEHIGVRVIRVRKFDGELLIIPAGDLRIFGNRSMEFARAIVNIGVSYEQDLEDIVPVLTRVASKWVEERSDIVLEPEAQVHAITDFMDSSVNLRVAVKVIPGEQWAAERQIRSLIKAEFDRLGIEIPFPRRTVYMRNEEMPSRRIADVPESADDKEMQVGESPDVL